MPDLPAGEPHVSARPTPDGRRRTAAPARGDRGGHEPDELIRLQRVLASAGIGSRRRCEDLIDEGRVEVDGQVVRRQGMRVDPKSAVIRVDGSRLVTDTQLVYLALHKPKGVVSTMSDDQGRPCVGDIVADRAVRLFHVGRLDIDTRLIACDDFMRGTSWS